MSNLAFASGRDWVALAVVLAWAPSLTPSMAGVPLMRNGGFEEGTVGWQGFWSRESGTGEAALDNLKRHSGAQALRVEHRGQQDWCVNSELILPVRSGQLFQLGGWTRIESGGSVTLAVVLRDTEGRALGWDYGASSREGPGDWRLLRSRMVIPEGAASIQPRWMGAGPVRAWLDDVVLERQGDVAALRGGLPSRMVLTNEVLEVALRPMDATVAVRDLRTGQGWEQGVMHPDIVPIAVVPGPLAQLVLLQVSSGLRITNTWELDARQPELVVTLAGVGELPKPLPFPHPFSSSPGTHLVLPMNEGISYPVEDPSIEPMRLIAYGGHGISMGFWGVSDGERGHMGIIETADDAAIRIERHAGRLEVQPEWDSQKQQFGPVRRLRYVFFDRGGHVAMAKRYRAWAERAGRFKTLAEKRRVNPDVDRLVGAVNVWCWERDAVSLVQEMQAAGIHRILWSNGQSPGSLGRLNELGVLTSRYDIYQDVMNPEYFPVLSGVHPDWVTQAWPQDVIRTARGDWLKGWEVRGTNGVWYPCGVICDRQAPAYAAQRIPAELATHPYRCRFIDTTTAAPWHECYAPGHPMTRTDSREWKMRLLSYVCDDQKLVTGCETGHDAAVPWVHYFEGMLSLGAYRIPDAGRDMARIWAEVPERVAKFQLGHRYRLPLWELVYHDCVVAQWYWGDYNNKLPALWDRRDLFNALYGTPPMFMFNRELWNREKARFVRSYRATAPVARATGYAEMIHHRFLTSDRDVQQTEFANGVRVTVNFRETVFRCADGFEMNGLTVRIEGLN